ncbi:Mitochondrial import protein Pam17 domain containing protein [Elaphomyces granulatus]
MHAMVVNTPVRSIVLGVSPATLNSFTSSYSGSVASPLTQRKVQRSLQQRRPATTLTSCQKIFPLRLPSQTGLLKLPSQQQHQAQTVRNGFRISRSNSTVSATTSNSHGTVASPPQPNTTILDWNTFFKLRASRRRYSLVSSILTSMASTAAGIQVLSTQDLEALGSQVMGLDPFVVLGLATAVCGAAGWLVGPFLGNAFWGLSYRRFKKGVAVKEKEFYDRIKRYRVDPSSNSLSNPVPDYYGEKIGSVQGYRQWLKDQRAYNRKRRSFIV